MLIFNRNLIAIKSNLIRACKLLEGLSTALRQTIDVGPLCFNHNVIILMTNVVGKVLAYETLNESNDKTCFQTPQEHSCLSRRFNDTVAKDLCLEGRPFLCGTCILLVCSALKHFSRFLWCSGKP